MTDDRQHDIGDDDLPEARSIRSRWPGLVWAVPLAALIIVAFLGVRALTHKGVDVVVTFGYVEGVTRTLETSPASTPETSTLVLPGVIPSA